jgi:hypothetical protein
MIGAPRNGDTPGLDTGGSGWAPHRSSCTTRARPFSWACLRGSGMAWGLSRICLIRTHVLSWSAGNPLPERCHDHRPSSMLRRSLSWTSTCRRMALLASRTARRRLAARFTTGSWPPCFWQTGAPLIDQHQHRTPWWFRDRQRRWSGDGRGTARSARFRRGVGRLGACQQEGGMGYVPPCFRRCRRTSSSIAARSFGRLVGCVNAFRQLVGTHGGGPQGGRVGALGFADPLRCGSARWLDPAAAARAPGAHGGRCRAGHRPAGHCCIERSPRATASTSPLKDDRSWARSSGSALSWRPSMKESLHFAGLR